jgi:macrolide-specific efflux system membrane fusion protein
VIAATLVVVVVGGSIYWFGFGIHAGAQSAQAATRTATASLQTMQKTVSGSGTLAPAVQDDVNFAASGTVTAVNVVAGSTVTAGQTLATLNTLTENASLTSAQASLASANAALSAAQTANDGSSAAVAKVSADQAAVAVAQASVDSAQAAYNGTTLTSPIAGLVTAVNLVVGDVVTNGSTSVGTSGSSGSSTSGSAAGGAGGGAGGAGGASSSSSSTATTTTTAQFTVVGTNAWQVTVSVGATDLKNIAVKQQVQLSSDENASFFGTVASIGLLPTTTTGAATYPVVVDVTGSPTDLYDGVTVTAAIVYERRDNVLSVPTAAVTTANGTSTVNKVVNGKTVKTTVTVGETVGNLTEITKGIAEGDQVTVPTFNPAALGGGAAGGARTGQGGAGGFPGGAGGGFPGGAGGGFGGGAGGGFGGGAGGRAGGGTNG